MAGRMARPVSSTNTTGAGDSRDRTDRRHGEVLSHYRTGERGVRGVTTYLEPGTEEPVVAAVNLIHDHRYVSSTAKTVAKHVGDVPRPRELEVAPRPHLPRPGGPRERPPPRLNTPPRARHST
jgi:hypothetical protein